MERSKTKYFKPFDALISFKLVLLHYTHSYVEVSNLQITDELIM